MNFDLINKVKNNKKLFSIFLILFFIFLSILVLTPFWTTGYLYSGADLQFHTSRIQEIVENIKHGVLIPGVATHTFNQVGDIVVTNYPWVTLYPFAFLMFVLKPVNAIYSGMAFYIFLTLIIAYYSMNLISKSRKISIYFAILYGYSSFFIFNTLNIQFGTFLSYTFFPLAITGLYLIMFTNYKKWYLLTLGTIGVMYSHVPSSIILFYTLLVLFLSCIVFQKKGERIKRFLYLIVAAISTIFLSLVVWGNIFNILLNQKIIQPQIRVLSQGAVNVSDIFLDTFTNFDNSLFSSDIGIGILAIIIFGWYFLKKVPKIAQIMYKTGIVTLFILSTAFPWDIVHYIPIINNIEGIQLTNRIFPIAILFLSGFGAYLLNWMNNQTNFYKEISRISIIAIIFFNWFGSISFVYYRSNITGGGLQSEQELNYKVDHNHTIPKANTAFPLENYKVNNNEYLNQFGNADASGVTDYYPVKAESNANSIISHNLIYGKNSISLTEQNINPGVNSLTYKIPINLNKGENVDLPFLCYDKFKYNVTVNDKNIDFVKSSNRNTINFKMPFNTKNPIIHINYLGNYFNYILIYVSLISWILLILYIIYLNRKL